jgi:uncharacterized membrane protein YccC
LSTIAPSLLDTLGGVVVGAITVSLWAVVQKVMKRA